MSCFIPPQILNQLLNCLKEKDNHFKEIVHITEDVYILFSSSSLNDINVMTEKKPGFFITYTRNSSPLFAVGFIQKQRHKKVYRSMLTCFLHDKLVIHENPPFVNFGDLKGSGYSFRFSTKETSFFIADLLNRLCSESTNNSINSKERAPSSSINNSTKELPKAKPRSIVQATHPTITSGFSWRVDLKTLFSTKGIVVEPLKLTPAKDEGPPLQPLTEDENAFLRSLSSEDKKIIKSTPRPRKTRMDNIYSFLTKNVSTQHEPSRKGACNTDDNLSSWASIKPDHYSSDNSESSSSASLIQPPPPLITKQPFLDDFNSPSVHEYSLITPPPLITNWSMTTLPKLISSSYMVSGIDSSLSDLNSPTESKPPPLILKKPTSSSVPPNLAIGGVPIATTKDKAVGDDGSGDHVWKTSLLMRPNGDDSFVKTFEDIFQEDDGLLYEIHQAYYNVQKRLMKTSLDAMLY